MRVLCVLMPRVLCVKRDAVDAAVTQRVVSGTFALIDSHAAWPHMHDAYLMRSGRLHEILLLLVLDDDAHARQRPREFGRNVRVGGKPNPMVSKP